VTPSREVVLICSYNGVIYYYYHDIYGYINDPKPRAIAEQFVFDESGRRPPCGRLVPVTMFAQIGEPSLYPTIGAAVAAYLDGHEVE
jgi:hypothetical protein